MEKAHNKYKNYCIHAMTTIYKFEVYVATT